MRTSLRAILLTLFWVPALVVCPATLHAAPQEPATPPPVSLDRIREGLGKPARQRLNLDVPIPPARPTFKARVDQRVFVMTLEEALHKEFDLNELQRQSAEWASKCCGLNIGQVFEVIDTALTEREIRKTREQIEQELAFIEAAARKAASVVK